jgi:hypothetical protein
MVAVRGSEGWGVEFELLEKTGGNRGGLESSTWCC